MIFLPYQKRVDWIYMFCFCQRHRRLPREIRYYIEIIEIEETRALTTNGSEKEVLGGRLKKEKERVQAGELPVILVNPFEDVLLYPV